jgi:hypothetical protein
MVYAEDLKSSARKGVPVRVRQGLPATLHADKFRNVNASLKGMRARSRLVLAGLVLGPAFTSLLLMLAACSENAAPVSPPLDGSERGNSETTTPIPPNRNPSADASDDSGVKRAPTGCILQSTGLTEGKKAESLPRSDVPNAAAWANPSQAIASDAQFATVTLGEGQESATLRVSDFGFNVPATAETWGIEVELKRRAPDGGVADSRIDVEIEGKPSRFKFMSSAWPTSIVGTHIYGQAVDTWGVDLFPADVNKPTFAATLTVKRAPGSSGPVTATVDSLKAAVNYCPEPIKK